MKGTLIKSNGVFDLLVDNTIYAQLPGGALSSLTHKLSIKNCEAVENGYDLDELSIANANEIKERWHLGEEWSTARIGFIKGFQKAMELMEGKKYNRQDVIHALTYGVSESKKKRTHSQILEEYRGTHLIEQTEWEVEIDMTEDWYDGFKSIPKLDKNGCLILKRI